jgi:hypothetical protein
MSSGPDVLLMPILTDAWKVHSAIGFVKFAGCRCPYPHPDSFGRTTSAGPAPHLPSSLSPRAGYRYFPSNLGHTWAVDFYLVYHPRFPQIFVIDAYRLGNCLPNTDGAYSRPGLYEPLRCRSAFAYQELATSRAEVERDGDDDPVEPTYICRQTHA